MRLSKKNIVENGKIDKIKILLVDDSENFLEVCKKKLESKYCVFTTNEPVKAVEIINDNNVDILIVDYLMVGITGIQIIEQVRAHCDVYIILMTGYIKEMPGDIAMKYDIDSYSEKADDFKDLILKLSIAEKSIHRYKYVSRSTTLGKTFGERLRSLRKAKDVTQDEVARVLGVARPTVTVYESGGAEPTLKHLRILAKYFNVSFDDLVDRIE